MGPLQWGHLTVHLRRRPYDRCGQGKGEGEGEAALHISGMFEYLFSPFSVCKLFASFLDKTWTPEQGLVTRRYYWKPEVAHSLVIN